MNVEDPLSLLGWRRIVAELYAQIREEDDPAAAWRGWRAVRDDLFREHPQSPLSQEMRARFGGLVYFDYDPAWRLHCRVEPLPAERHDITTSGGTTMSFIRFGAVTVAAPVGPLRLEVYWLDSYSGGVYLPFRDATSGAETYGGGRYLLDTAKGADLGSDGDALVLDFNFAYNPSCSYDPRWSCPLSPPANRLDMPVRAGERYDASLLEQA